MNLDRALTHLETIGIDTDVLRAGGVDPTDPAAVRREVAILLATAVAEQLITDMRGFAALQRAFTALLTPAERVGNAALAAAIRTDLVAAGVLRPATPTEPAGAFEACLATV